MRPELYIERVLQAVFIPGDTVEIRALLPGQPPRLLATDVFREAAKFARKHSADGRNVYFAVNPVVPGRGKHVSAKAHQVVRRNDFFIDVDPERFGVPEEMKSKVCSTDQEKLSCDDVITSVRALVEGRWGWPAPIATDSGSGQNLHYLAALDCELAPAAWQAVLHYIAAQCDTDRAKVDPGTYILTQGARLAGTTNRKGAHTEERPQRLAKVLDWAVGTPRVTRAMLDHAIEDSGIQFRHFEPSEAMGVTEQEVRHLVAGYPEHLRVLRTGRTPEKTLFYLAACPWVGRKHQWSNSCIVLHQNGNLGYWCFAGTCPCNHPVKLHFRDLLFHLRDLTRRDHDLRAKYYPDDDEMLAMFNGDLACEGPVDDRVACEEVAPCPAVEPAATLREPVRTPDPEEVAIELAPQPVAAPEPERRLPEPCVIPAVRRRLHLDSETKSELDIEEVGLDPYWDHASTELLLLAWAFDDDPVQVVDLADGKHLPSELVDALTNPAVEKCAWNAPFEICAIMCRLGLVMDLRQWTDPMVLSRYIGFPGSLEGCAVALNLAQLKDERGKELIKMFSCRTKSTAKQIKAGMSELYWRDTASDPEPWAEFISYCKGDVEVERAALRELETYTKLPEAEQALWRFDQMVNFRGLPLDLQYIDNAWTLMKAADQRFAAQLKELTHLENTNSCEQMKGWLAQNRYPMESIAKDKVEQALADPDLPGQVREALILHQKISSGTGKLDAFKARVSSDGRLRHQYVFEGTHTHRWASKGVQVQNLSSPTKPVEKRLVETTDAIRAGFIPEGLDAADALTGTIRSAIRVHNGYKLFVCDLKSIESRVLALLSGCRNLLDIYLRDLDAYIAFGSILFGVPYEEVTKEQRGIAKPSTLGCGYNMGKVGLRRYAKKYGVEMTEEEADRQVKLFRRTYPEVKKLWYCFGDLALSAVRERRLLRHFSGIKFDGRDPRFLAIELLSGGRLYYLAPEIGPAETPWGAIVDNLTYLKSEYSTMVRTSTYGGKLVENVVQGVARDVLCADLLDAHDAGFHVVGHCHDEIITVESVNSGLDIRLLEGVMSKSLSWAPSLILGAKGHEGDCYHK
jgi:DNA polymerase